MPYLRSFYSQISHELMISPRSRVDDETRMKSFMRTYYCAVMLIIRLMIVNNVYLLVVGEIFAILIGILTLKNNLGVVEIGYEKI